MTGRRTQSTTYPDLVDYVEFFLSTADSDDWDAQQHDLVQDLRDEIVDLRARNEGLTRELTVALATIDASNVNLADLYPTVAEDDEALDALAGTEPVFEVTVSRSQIRPTVVRAPDARRAAAAAHVWTTNMQPSGFDAYQATYGIMSVDALDPGTVDTGDGLDAALILGEHS